MTNAPSADELLSSDAPELAFDASHSRALAYLEAYDPPDEAQRQTRDEIVRFVERAPRPLERENLEGHLTASALIVAPDGRALLMHHRKLDRWLQMGGHCDGDANLAAAALREAEEESGIDGLVIDPRIVDVDIHTIPGRPASAERSEEPEHLHLDCRFVVLAPEGAVEHVSHESIALGWFMPENAIGLDLDESLVRFFRVAFGG
jgi:8-oxo-dGTP pyrophosphatase MutT (NUDIX family)